MLIFTLAKLAIIQEGAIKIFFSILCNNFHVNRTQGRLCNHFHSYDIILHFCMQVRKPLLVFTIINHLSIRTLNFSKPNRSCHIEWVGLNVDQKIYV